MPSAQYVSPAQCADLLGLSLATVHRRLADGGINYIQPGGKWTAVLIPLAQFELVDAEATEPAASIEGEK